MTLKKFIFSIMLISSVHATALAQANKCEAIFSALPKDIATKIQDEYLKRFDELFKETSGFSSYHEFEKMIRSRQEPEIKRALEILDGQKIHVAMAVPEAVRENIAKDRFLNCAVHVISSALTGRDGEPLVLVMSSKLSKVWKMASRSALRFSYTLFVPTCESRIAFVATV